jgi:outer membrane protein
VERARITALNQEVINRQMRQQLKTDVQTAVTNAKASKRNLEAARLSMEAAQAAFDNAQNRFELGAINSLEYTTARNNLDQAQVTLTQAKYQYLFDLKVVDFYLGRELTLD